MCLHFTMWVKILIVLHSPPSPGLTPSFLPLSSIVSTGNKDKKTQRFHTKSSWRLNIITFKPCNKPMKSPKRILSSQFYEEMWVPVDKRISLKLLQTFVTNYCSEAFTLSFTSLYFRILGFRSMLWLSLAKTEMMLCKFQVLYGSVYFLLLSCYSTNN